MDNTVSERMAEKSMWQGGIPALLVASTFMPWFSASFGSFGRSATGVDTDTGVLIAILGAAAFVIWWYSSMSMVRKGWIVTGGLSTLLSIGWVLNANSKIGQAREEMAGNPFAAGVEMNIAMGAYIAIAASVAVFYAGYKIPVESDTTLRDFIGSPREPERE